MIDAFRPVNSCTVPTVPESHPSIYPFVAVIPSALQRARTPAMSLFGRPFAELFPLMHLALPAWGLLTFAPRWKVGCILQPLATAHLRMTRISPQVSSTVATATALGFSGLYVALVGAVATSAQPVKLTDLPQSSLQVPPSHCHALRQHFHEAGATM